MIFSLDCHVFSSRLSVPTYYIHLLYEWQLPLLIYLLWTIIMETTHRFGLILDRIYVSSRLLPVPIGIRTFSAVFQVPRALPVVLAICKKLTFCWSSTRNSISISVSQLTTVSLIVPDAPIIIGTVFILLSRSKLSLIQILRKYIFIDFLRLSLYFPLGAIHGGDNGCRQDSSENRFDRTQYVTAR